MEIGIGGAQPLQLSIGKTIAQLEVVPAGIGCHVLSTHIAEGFLHVRIGGSKQTSFHLIQRTEAQIPAPGNIEGGQISTQPH